MKIQTFSLHSYAILLTNGQRRSGFFLCLIDAKGNCGWGEIAPLEKWSKETVDSCLQQIEEKKQKILSTDWSLGTCFQELANLILFPSVSFGLESALLSILDPIPPFSVPVSALLMGSVQEILEQANIRYREGYTSAKLKVSQLSFEEAAYVIHQLKDWFRLRIDVNRAWNNIDSLQFFTRFPLDAFDYVEEPFQNPHELAQFPHPLAVDESFPETMSLEQLESLPTLKALIYKPTIQGGLLGCLPLHEWSKRKGISLVLSSSFESDLGLANVASIAHRLSLLTPLGIGTYHYLDNLICVNTLKFFQNQIYIPADIRPRIEMNCIAY